VIAVTAMNRALRQTAEDGSLRESAMTKIIFLAALALAIGASTFAEVRTFAEFTVADSGE
jgi:hypothetical protein